MFHHENVVNYNFDKFPLSIQVELSTYGFNTRANVLFVYGQIFLTEFILAE